MQGQTSLCCTIENEKFAKKLWLSNLSENSGTVFDPTK